MFSRFPGQDGFSTAKPLRCQHSTFGPDQSALSRARGLTGILIEHRFANWRSPVVGLGLTRAIVSAGIAVALS